MSTVTSMISAGVSGVSGSSYTSSSSSASATLDKLSQELVKVRSSTTLTDEEKQEQLNSINEKISDLVSTQTSSASSGSNIVSSMLGQKEDNTDKCDFSFFFGSGYTLANVKSLASASRKIESEARILTGEIAVDKIRGLDTSDKEEKLTNLTANVSILNQNLASQIESALADEGADQETLSVIGQINEELKANQEKLDKEFGKTEETAEAVDTDSTQKADEATATE